MGMLRIMSRRGDERVVWNSEQSEAYDSEAVAAIREAERIFNEERARGSTAFKVESGKPVERIEQFDRTAEPAGKPSGRCTESVARRQEEKEEVVALR